MQGQRTDLKYKEICKYIKQKQPISIADLSNYLLKKHNIMLNVSRSRLITRMVQLKLIVRLGKPNTKKSEFIIFERQKNGQE